MTNQNVYSTHPLPYKNPVTKFQSLNTEDTFELTNFFNLRKLQISVTKNFTLTFCI